MNLQSYRTEGGDIVLLTNAKEDEQILDALSLAAQVLYNANELEAEEIIRQLKDALYI